LAIIGNKKPTILSLGLGLGRITNPLGMIGNNLTAISNTYVDFAKKAKNGFF
jgi:16S rRNA A1518/A1519 N6-dimethyltransferase RsmA/KsgA/DIM1 with predicted DNA glycosylase/AP lyase activity